MSGNADALAVNAAVLSRLEERFVRPGGVDLIAMSKEPEVYAAWRTAREFERRVKKSEGGGRAK